MSTPNLAIAHILATQAQKEVTANAAFDALDQALTDSLTIPMADADQTPSTTNCLTHIVFICTGALTAGRNLIVPNNKKLYLVKNSTTGGFSITVKTAAGSGVAISAATSFIIVYCDGGNVVQMTTGAVTTVGFTQLTDAPASYSGAGGYAVEVNAGATAVVFSLKPVDVPVFVAGLFTASQVLLYVPLARSITFKQNLPSSVGKLSVAATASTVFSIQKNGAQFATLTFAIAGAVGTFVCGSDVTFAAGDILSVVAPASPDATAASLGLTLVGIRN